MDLARQTLANMGLKIREVDDATGYIRATKGLSIKTYGHVVEVQLEAANPSASTETALTISSRVRFPQLVDYGTNNQIISQFENQLKNLVRTSGKAAGV